MKSFVLTWTEEVDLTKRWQEHQDVAARDRLVASCYRLVTSIAKKLKGYLRPPHVTWEDLIQEGRIGLLVAANHFDISRNTHFMHYAYQWIYAFMVQYVLDHQGAVRLFTSKNARKVFFRYSWTRALLEQITPNPSADEIAKALGVPVKTLDVLTYRGQNVDIHALPLACWENLFDSIADRQELDLQRSVVSQAIEKLPDSQRRVMQLRREGKSPTEVGRHFNFSKANAQQAEKRALRAIRNDPQVRQLREADA